MVDASWFADLPDDFEESVRIDREVRKPACVDH